ncbi:MAG: nuclear transport factor 2 family protein [Acetobacteraceae bacterium]|nr:nuclear transport factor 2 family protein [Acetobacteraceae bacterium]
MAGPTSGTLERVQAIYAEYARGNRAFALDALAPEVVWTSVAASPDMPWGGTRHGRAGVEEYFARLDSMVAITGYEIERFIADGDWVIVLARATGRFHATGEELVLNKVDVLRLEGGRIAEFREHYDTAALLGCVARCGGRPA